MAPGNNERHPGHTGTIPKTKVRNNCNVPQEAVTPTRRDMSTNLVSTSLDWVPVSEYNTRATYGQSRKPTNNTSDHELTDLDNSVSFESGFGRFVPVRPQPRALPLNIQNRENISSEPHDDGTGSSISGHTLHPYAHQMQNGLIPQTSHTSAAVMIVNPTTPITVTGNVTQPFNATNQNRNNLTRNLNQSRNNLDGGHASNNNTTPSASNSRTGTKTVNLMNNMYEQGQGGFNNHNESNHVHRESARALGEAIAAACPDAAAVERRLGQIREYIRVTSTLVDTMRNSEEEDAATRPVSAQSNGSTYSENELWQNEIKNKMEVSQMRLAALKQQQKRLLKYQEEAKHQLEEMNRDRQRQAHETQPSTSHDNFVGVPSQLPSGNYQQPNRMYAANQIGVATTLAHSADALHAQHSAPNNLEAEHGHPARPNHGPDDRFSHRDAHVGGSEERAGGARDSELEEDDDLLNERSQVLQLKLRELRLKKQHMESLVQEFQKLQVATQLESAHNTYSSSGEESADEDPSGKCNKSSSNKKNEDPFKLMEIKAIKTALQKTKDLMRSVENYEVDNLSQGHEDSFRDMANHSNILDNKSEGGGSFGGWSNDGSVCRVRNTLPQRAKFTNEQHSHQHHALQHQQSHEANIATLQELAQELRAETEKIMGERARIKDMISNKEVSRRQKKVNEEVRGAVPAPGPAERRQLQLRALLADRQRELDALLSKEKATCAGGEAQSASPGPRAALVNQSYNGEQDHISEPESRSEQILIESQDSRDNENFRGSGAGASAARGRAGSVLPAHVGSAYGSDTDSASRNNSNQRNRARRRQPQERLNADSNVNAPPPNTNQNVRREQRAEPSNVNLVPPISQNTENLGNAPYAHLPPPCWNSNKSNQDMRNQFTQNSHSQTMERLLGTPQVPFAPSVPFSMMVPYGMVGGCACGCGFWGAWCWQQLVMQQREIHQLREQLNHLEERWRAETASHTLNNQVPPGNRANNYWDNFRSYSRQNLLSASNKANADGHLGVGQAHNPHPLVERSHNTLRRTPSAASPCVTPKRNTNAVSSSQNTAHTSHTNNDDILSRYAMRNVAYERSLSFSSAPDVLNVNQNPDSDTVSVPHARNTDDANAANAPNVNINLPEPASNSFRNLNITNPIQEIIQAHSNNLNTSANSKKKSSSKLPAKNSTNGRNFTLDYSQMSNINIASTSETPNPNLASTSREVQDKAASKLFDLLRENVYSEVTALIDVNESHPDFLIQLFRELQFISSDALRQKVLQSIRSLLSQYSSVVEDQSARSVHEENRQEVVTTTSGEPNVYSGRNSLSAQSACGNSMQIDNKIVRFLLLKSEETCTTEFIETLASLILNNVTDGRYSQHSRRRLLELLSKYEGMRVCDVSGDIIENMPLLVPAPSDNEQPQHANELSESSMMQDVAGSLNLFSSSDSQLHQMNACPYDMWPGHMHMDMEPSDLNDSSPRSSQEGKVDLINCSERHNGDLAEADQTCRSDADELASDGRDDVAANAEALPDAVDTEEVTPTEAEAEWLGLDRVPTRLHAGESSEKQKD